MTDVLPWFGGALQPGLEQARWEAQHYLSARCTRGENITPS
jgi:hypothetical protein